MGAKWAGMVVTGDQVRIVQLEIDRSGTYTLNDESDWKLQKGDRASAYKVMHKTIIDYLNENEIEQVVIKASATNPGGMRLSHLSAAELRGVVISAAAYARPKVTVLPKAKLSKSFGQRKADQYVADDDFWDDRLDGVKLKKGSREAALMILAVEKDRRKFESKS